MPPVFHPKLINGPFDDPGLFVPFLFEKRALIFDLGENSALFAKDILKISDVFISHTHMDHFIGFDRLLRLLLGRDKILRLFGPEGFIKNVAGRLSSYTWNLVQHYPHPLVLEVTEVHRDRLVTRKFSCADMFEPAPETTVSSFSGVLLSEPAYTVSAVVLDHRVACLGFSLEEKFHINILKDRVLKLGLEVGPWLRELKLALYREEDPETLFTVPDLENDSSPRVFTLGELARQITRRTPGQKITYITDVAGSPENIEKIISFSKNSDHLFIEASFLDEDREIADSKYHLTARMAGLIAGKAGARAFSIFHFSPRYEGRGELLEKEARGAFEGLAEWVSR